MPEAPKVTLFTEWLVEGGIERVMLNLGAGLSDLGLAVDLVVPRSCGLYPGRLDPRVRLIDLGARRMLTGLPGFVRYLRQRRPAAILSAHEHANVVALWARRWSRSESRSVISIHTLDSERPGHPSNPRGEGRLLFWATRFCYPWADGIIAVSQPVLDELSASYPALSAGASVIRSPLIHDETFRQASEVPRHTWFAPGAPPVILSAGRICAPKDFATLLAAFAKVRREHLARLVILGEGPDRPKLEELVRSLGIESEVAWPGFQANPFAYMRRSAVFVLSSRVEGMPAVLIEAMACGVPVVATRAEGGVVEALAHGRYGLLVPVGDAEALAVAIARVLRGQGIPPPEESWQPFRVSSVACQYRDVLLGSGQPAGRQR